MKKADNVTIKQPSTTAARIAVLAIFFVNGGNFVNWAARIPAFKERFNFSEGTLGLILMAISIGVVVALGITSKLIARFGSKATTIGGAVMSNITLALLPLMPNPIALWLMLLIWGGAIAVTDMSMNTQASEVERRRGKPTMSSFHASFSVGGLVGALIGAWMASQNISPLNHFAIVGVVYGVISLIAMPYLLHVEGEQRSGESAFTVPPRAVWALGAVALFSALGEGAIIDWSAVYLEKVMQTPAHIAALGLAAFNVTMTIGRFSGDWLAHHVAPAVIARVGGLVAGLGLLAAMFIPNTYVALAGFGAVGIGLSNVVPLAFSAAGNVPGIPASKGIASVATIAYAAFLAGPPVIGQVAELTSFQVALGGVAILMLMIAVFAGALRRVPADAPHPAHIDTSL